MNTNLQDLLLFCIAFADFLLIMLNVYFTLFVCLFLCKDHYENKVVKPVLCHPCQYHCSYCSHLSIFYQFFVVFSF